MPVLVNFALIAVMTVIVLVVAPVWIRLSRRYGWRISQRQVYLTWAVVMMVLNGRSLLTTDPRSPYFVPQLLLSVFLVGAPLYRAWRPPKEA